MHCYHKLIPLVTSIAIAIDILLQYKVSFYLNNMLKFYKKALSRNHPLNKKSGFTLLEILLVVGIISVLAGIVIVAINPGRQLATVRNTERRSDIKQINSAVLQYYIDHSYYPASTTLTTTLTEICDTGALSSPSGVDCGSLLDLSELVPTYITAIPTDPSGASSTLSLIPKVYAATGGTGYKIAKSASNKIVVTAPEAELGAMIAIGTTTVTTVEEGPDPCYATSYIYVGTECTGGAIYAGELNDWQYMTTPTDAGGYAWSLTGVETGITNTTDGAENTATLAALSGNYPAADYCAGLDVHGYDDWFLPAKDELYHLYDWNLEIGGFDTSSSNWEHGYMYWSSTEVEYWSVWNQNFKNSEQQGSSEYDWQFNVRCVRKY